MMYWSGGAAGAWSYALMAVSMLLFWGLVVAAVVTLVRYLGGTSARGRDIPGGQDAPEGILAQRFARGDIDEEEYRRRLNILRGAATPDLSFGRHNPE